MEANKLLDELRKEFHDPHTTTQRKQYLQGGIDTLVFLINNKYV